MKIKLDSDALMPERKHSTDAGLDLKSTEDCTIPAHEFRTVNTGVHVQLPPGTVGMLKSRSGMNTKHGITSTGVVDEGYEGPIKVALHNDSNEEYIVKRGDRVTQLVVLPVLYEDVELVDEITGGERGDNGYGSTGR